MSAVIACMTACVTACVTVGGGLQTSPAVNPLEKTQGMLMQCHATPGLEAASNQPESGDQETKRDPERELDLSWPGLSGAQLAAQHPVSLGGVSRVPARLMAVSGL